MIREDLSELLIHWTSGMNNQEAFDVLYKIITSEVIQGSTNCIKGSYRCVCLTETPARCFSFQKRSYKPFGIGVTKKYLYSLGGRPVIYESDKEFNILPDNVKWRHVLYDPCLEPPIDFTWEREWRIKEDVYLDLQEVLIVVPDADWEVKLINRFDHDESIRYQWESLGYGQDLARWPESFPYALVNINEL